MSSDRDRFGEGAERLLPKDARPPAKRPAPDPRETTRSERARKRQRQNQKYGVPTGFRWPEEFRAALEAAEKKYRYSKKDLVMYATIQLLRGLENGSIELPVVGGELRQIAMPPIPEISIDE